MIKSRQLTAAGVLRSAANVTALESEAEGLDVAVAPAAEGDAVAAWLNGSVHRVQAAYGP